MGYMRLGDLLVAAGVLTEQQLSQALAAQKGTRRRLGQVLVEEGMISEGQLLETLEMQLGIDFVDLSRVQIPAELAQVVPRAIARRHSVVPVKLERDALVLAMADPLNYVALEDVRSASRRRVIPRIAPAAAVDRAIAALYGNEGAARAMEEMRWESGGREQVRSPRRAESLEEETTAAPTVRLVNAILERAATERASDIHLEPREDGMAVRMRVDGLLRFMLQVPEDLQGSVTARLKVMGGMDPAERRVPQDGRATVRFQGREMDLRLSTLPTIRGEKVVIRLLDVAAQPLDAEALGLEGENLRRWRDLLRNAHGMLLVVGPTGSGKSSTMYAMIRALNTEERSLVTLEDPVEYRLEGVCQVQISRKTGMTFADGLRAVLRQDPDIIAVGEIRDRETAEIALRAAITGHLVLSTVHTNDARSALDRLLDIGVESYLLGEALKGILSQRLVRRICPECRQPRKPSPDELELLDLEAEKDPVFCQGRGCPHCWHTGYRGRIGVFEILTPDHALRRAIVRGEHRAALEQMEEGERYSSLREGARRLVLEGVTTAAEAVRILHSSADG